MRYLIVAGGRNFSDYVLAYEQIHQCVQSIDDEVAIVSGGAKGADTMGEAYALLYDLPLIRYLAKWGEHGRAAGPIRNSEMAEIGTDLLAFWDGQSRGTKDMITKAKSKGMAVTIVYYED